MPELPEVQTTVNGIKRKLTGLVIRDVWTDYASTDHSFKETIKNGVYFKTFKKHTVGATIVDASRRGKNVLIHLSNGKTILIHMKMTGHIMYGSYEKRGPVWRATKSGPLRDDPFNRFIHFVISFKNDNHMVLSDMRKFAKITLLETSRMQESIHISHHGPEPLDATFDTKALVTALMKKPKSPIKTALMNHELVSGIGNIYSDEILWRAGVNPLERVEKVSKKKWHPIWKAMKETLKKGIDFGGDSMSDYRNIDGVRGKFQDKHSAYRKTGEHCSKRGCNGTIVRVKIGGRSAHFCDTHQKLATL